MAEKRVEMKKEREEEEGRKGEEEGITSMYSFI